MGKQQRGGTLLGFIIGVIIGLGVGLGVAVYVTKVPVPFVSNADHRDIEKTERERNSNWDPNAPLYGNSNGPAAAQPPVAPQQSAPVAVPADPVAKPPASAADPLGDLANAQVKASEAKAAAQAQAAAAANDGFHYFVQAGAFRTKADADAQKAKLAMLGWEASISEREQNGRPVFRVRTGPFTKRGDAEQLKQKLDAAGVDSALVRVQQ